MASTILRCSTLGSLQQRHNGSPKVRSVYKVLFEFYQDRITRPIVHRVGGMLLQAKKEFAICGDIRPDDVFFYYTTTFVSLSVTYPYIS